MITEQDLQAAIAECEGARNPTSSTCIKLAAFYTIRNELFGESTVANNEPARYSYAAPPVNEVENATYESDTEFSQAIHGKRMNDVLAVMDELMQTLSVINPRLYASVIRKLQ